MKVLILHQHFNTPASGGPLRSYYLAKALIQKGIDVAVITGSRASQYRNENFEGIDIHYVPVAYENRFGFYKRGLSFARYAVEAVRITGLIKDVSLVYAISVPLTVGQAAIWIQRRYGIPFYFEVGDLWPEAPVQMGFIRSPFLKHSLYWLERRIYKKASKVVALSEPIKESIRSKAPTKEILVIPNMSDTEFLGPSQKDIEVAAKFGVSDQFVISYMGAVGFANGLDYFLECARACQKAELPVQFIICGEGAMTGSLQSAVKTLKLQNLHFLPLQDREGVRQVLSVTDAAFICYKPFPVLETGSPNKYFDGLAAGKTIIVNFRGWIRDEVLAQDCGLALDPRFPQEIVSQLKPLLENRTIAELKGANARKLAEAKYSRKELGERFAALFVR